MRIRKHTWQLVHLVEILRQRFADRPLRAVEIGVMLGVNSAELLKTCEDVHLTMIDPWCTNPDYQAAEPGDVSTWDWRDWEKARAQARIRTEPYADRRTIRWMTSKDAALLTRDYSLHMVFVDGDHRAEGVLFDTETWWHKLTTGKEPGTPGGILAWHDWNLASVRDTVTAWAEKHGLILSPGMGRTCWTEKRA